MRRRYYHKQDAKTVRQIRRMLRDGFTQSQLALAFSTCQSNIHYIGTHQTWQHVGSR